MNHDNPNLAKTEIIKQLGYFPAFLIPALSSSLIYRSLVQQTLFAYINNPLPSKFKEKLFVSLSRYYGISYFTICHSCTLRSLKITLAEILALENIGYPQSEAEVTTDIQTLSVQWQSLKNCHGNLNLDLEASLLRCSNLLFTNSEQTANLSATLKSILGTVCYHYLIVFLGYVKLCHQWLRSNQDISHQQDRRSQLHLGSMLLEEGKLAKFLTADLQSQSYLAKVSPDDLPMLNRSGYPEHVSPSFPILKQKTFTACLANAPFPVMIHDESGKIVYLNDNWLEATGYDAPEITTLSEWNQKAQVKQRAIVRLPTKTTEQPDRKCILPARQTKISTTTALQQIVDSLLDVAPNNLRAKQEQIADAIRSEVIICSSSGKQIFWELYTAALDLDLPEAELTISIAKDITDIVNHDNKLAELEAKLRLVLESTKTGNWSWDLNSSQVDICHRGRTVLGLDDFDGTYTGFLKSIHPRERESVDLEVARAVQAHRDLDLAYSIEHFDGEIAQVRTTGKIHYNFKGQPVRLTGIVTDVTPAQAVDRDAENLKQNPGQNIAKSLTQLETVINLLPYYLLVVDIQTQTISLLNSGLAKSLCLSDSEAIGKTIAECFDLEYATQINWQHQQALNSQQLIHLQEEVTLLDGIHYFDTVVTPLYDSQGEIYALLRTSSDIPDLAAAQEALSQRTLQLEAANRELESFSYSVSHDLQAPLRIINGFSQILWEDYQPNLDDRGKHYLQRIQANSKRMSNLIDALLQLSRVTRSQMKSGNVNLSAIATDIIEELRAENPQRQVEVTIAPSLKTKGDPQLLRIVLSNLLHNAWKYTSRRSHSEIEFGSIIGNVSQPTYFVKDNGAGFDREYAEKLFTAFQRLHSEAEFPGTGIGLATVQRIIYRHGGKVWAEGKCDRGATIYFSL